MIYTVIRAKYVSHLQHETSTTEQDVHISEKHFTTDTESDEQSPTTATVTVTDNISTTITPYGITETEIAAETSEANQETTEKTTSSFVSTASVKTYESTDTYTSTSDLFVQPETTTQKITTTPKTNKPLLVSIISKYHHLWAPAVSLFVWMCL